MVKQLFVGPSGYKMRDECCSQRADRKGRGIVTG